MVGLKLKNMDEEIIEDVRELEEFRINNIDNDLSIEQEDMMLIYNNAGL